MQRFYLVPMKFIDTSRGPKYIKWSSSRGTPGEPTDLDIGSWVLMDYGFLPTALLLAKDISQANHDALTAHSDVYGYPLDLDQPITDPGIDAFFESISIPTDWLTPSTTYRELLRQTAAMFQFSQRYSGISGSNLIDDSGGLDSNYNSWSQQTKDYFTETLDFFGYPHVAGNPKLRQMIKQAGSLWGNTPFNLGGASF